MNNPLLSIIIPTKNRQYTCLFAIESALAIQNDDFEVIVQDCSDTDILRSQIIEKFGQDTRIKYFHTDSKPSMTDNWNMAYDKATGDYQCGIGDDDAVLKEIYEVAKWAKENEIDAVTNASKITYNWPDFDSVLYKGCFIIHNIPTNRIVKKAINSSSIRDIVLEPRMNYAQLPMIYHCVISKNILLKIKYITIALLKGTSLDVYSSIVISSQLSNYYALDYPFTIRGACGNSNSNRISTGNTNIHFKEFKSISWGKLCPPIYSLHTTLFESITTALTAINKTELIEKMNLPLFYAKLLAEQPRYARTILTYGTIYFKKNTDWVRFVANFISISFKQSKILLISKSLRLFLLLFGESITHYIAKKLGLKKSTILSETILSEISQIVQLIPNHTNYEKISSPLEV